MKSTTDIVIIGAGVIGCSTAYHLAQAGLTDVIVVEMGQVGSGVSSQSASMLSLQFSHDELAIRMARYCYDRYLRFEEELDASIDFRPTGWLYLATEASAAELLARARRLQAHGVATEILDPAEIKRRYPEINTSDLVVGTFGPDDGPLDPHMVMWGYVRRAMSLGVTLAQGVRATGLQIEAGRVCGVETTAGPIACDLVINAAGPWAAQVGRWAGLEIPIVNKGRTILVTGPFPDLPSDRPFVEDVSAGWYCRPEMEGVLMGMGLWPVEGFAASTTPAMINSLIDAAVHRVPVLERADMLTAWTGIRPLTPDGRPILGAVDGLPGLLLNCGWGGAGIIQAPIAGQLLAELAATGQTSTLEIEPFSIGRFFRNRVSC